MVDEFDFLGTIDAIQPWVSMHRSFDQRQEEYLGYLLRIRMRDGATITLGIDEVQQEQAGLQGGDMIEGAASGDRALHVRVLVRSKERRPKGPPWLGVPGSLDLYEERGFRRLDERSFRGACRTCSGPATGFWCWRTTASTRSFPRMAPGTASTAPTAMRIALHP